MGKILIFIIFINIVGAILILGVFLSECSYDHSLCKKSCDEVLIKEGYMLSDSGTLAGRKNKIKYYATAFKEKYAYDIYGICLLKNKEYRCVYAVNYPNRYLP